MAFRIRSLLLFYLFTGYITLTASSWASWHHPTSDFHPSRRLHYKNPRNAPSEYCPRDENLAQQQQQGRICLRKCISDEDCKSKRKKCLCDGACGLSCIKPERECGDAEPPPDLGEVHMTGKMFGSKAIYSCPDGFRVIGIEARICQADGSWSGSPPVCKKNIFCTQPPIIDHARHNAPLEQTTFALDTSLQYQCFPGYTTKGFARTKCFFYNGTAKWFGPDITCDPRSCGEPPSILNGRREGECHHFTCKVTYVCQPGFELLGKAEQICQSDGTWAPVDLPSCVPVQCPIPEHPDHGKVVYSSIAFNSVITYECKYGYMLVGEATRRCGENKRWTGTEPKCREINCGSPGILHNGWLEGSRTTLHAVVVFHCLQGTTFEGTSDRSVCQSDGTWSHPLPRCHEINCGSSGILPNGWLENLEGGTAFGASIIFRCFSNMTLLGHSSTVCDRDGKWINPLPFCLAPCTIPPVAFGNVTSRPDTIGTHQNETANTIPMILRPGTIVPHGKIIGVECEKRYEPTYNITPSTCFNGSWTHAPKCQPARCKALPKAPRYGMVIAPKTEHGMKARFTCRDGYNLVGHNVTECQYGEWLGEPPICNQTYCKYPGSIPNGKVLLVGNMGLYDYRNYVTKVANNRQITYECYKGYVLTDGPLGKTCIHGEWSPKTEPPRCIPSQHPNFRWIRKKRRAIKTGGGSIVRNKALSGSGASGTRRGTRRKKTHEGEEDYDPSPMECEDLDIDPYIQFELVEKGDDENSSFSSGSVLKVSCTAGYGVNLPNATVKCVHGNWKPVPPQCDALPCKTPHILHGSFFNSSAPKASKGLYFQEAMKHTKQIILRCSKGYILHGPHTMTCWYGEWDVSEPPECVPASCSLPKLEHGNYIGNLKPGSNVTHDTKVEYHCEGSYRKIVLSPSICHLGEWRPNKPMCLHRSIAYNYSNSMETISNGQRGCSQPPHAKGAIVYSEGKPVDYDNDFSFPEETIALYKCANPKPKAQNRWRLNCTNATWVGSPSLCEGDVPEGLVASLLKMISGPCQFEKKEEHVVTFLDNNEVTQEGIEYDSGSVLVSRCTDIGKFELHGSKWRKCISGQWLGVKPTCEGLSQFNDYSLDRPPTILFRYVNGSIVQSNDGKLVVYPGTTLHMECIWTRKFGKPDWRYDNTTKQYVTGWTDGIPDRSPTLEYRLTIENAQPDDSMTFTCFTPSKLSHSITVIVSEAECPPHPEQDDLVYSTDERILGTVVNFTCRSGNTVVGAQQIYCSAYGNWSAPYPRCENVECPDISLLPAMAPLAYTSVTRNGTLNKNETAPPKVIIPSGRHIGSKVYFTCPDGFTIHGSSEATCQTSGQWDSAIPLCKEIECTDPPTPENGFISGNPPYKPGDFAQFECDPGFIVDKPQTTIACQDNGKWSRAPELKCIPGCTYPGTIIGGTIKNVQFKYKLQDTVEFDCNDGYELIGARMIHCLKGGKWSNTIPNCRPKG